ncbi:MAG: hypothetical protein FWE18_03560 [Alphaproteobacteria bacterium]|nr:hypothetical protein [Alphaproteobacteria bacterium]
MNQFGTGIKDKAVFKAKLRQVFIVISAIFKIHTSFSDETLNVVDFAIKGAISHIYKFQKFLKSFTINNQYRISITFQKDSLFLSPKINNLFV